MMQMEIKFDAEELNRKLTKYVQVSKKVPAEAINKKLKDVALQATKTTKAASKEQIRAERMAPSRVNANAPLQAILLNSKVASGWEWNKLNLRTNPAEMQVEVEKAVKKAERSANFIRAGWKKAADKMRQWVKEIGGEPPVDTNIQARGDGLGKAKPAVENDAWIVEGSVTNSVHGKNNSPKIQHLAEVGAQAAVQRVIADMDVYLERKAKEALQSAGL
jgi:hypothetical protein